MTTTVETEQSTEIIEESLPAVVDVEKNDATIFSVLDRLDDDLILDELKDRVVTEWVYRFKQDGKEVCNLSKAGVDACCTEMARTGHIIEEDEVKYTQDPSDPEYFLFTVIARRVLIDSDGDRKVMETVNGAKRQSTKIKGKPNNFWFEQGCMKACRNARNRLIPEEIKAKIMAAAKSDGRVKHVTKEDVEKKVGMGDVNPRKDPDTYATGADKRFVEAWIRDYLNGKRDLFKQWAESYGMIDEGTLNKVHLRFAQRIKANPDDAAANFNRWYVDNKAQEAAEVLEGEVVNG